MLPDVTLTPAAQNFMRRMVRFGGRGAEAGFRLAVTSGGCSGYDAKFSIEAAALAGDETLELAGLKVFLPADSRVLLEGVIVDFADAPTNSGLTFLNPSAAACGCGSSPEAAAAPGVTKIGVDSIRRR